MARRRPAQSIFAAAANALADAGEWEWCLVILEELEQHSDALETRFAEEEEGGEGGGSGGRGDVRGFDVDVIGDGRGRIGESVPEVGTEADTVIRLELNESGLPVPLEGRKPTATTTAAAAGASAAATSVADTLSTYTAAVRACGTGGAGVEAVVGILERMRWAGVEPGEETYGAAISAFRACGGVWEEGGEVMGESAVSAADAARALIEWEETREGAGGAGDASPFLYSAAMKACAEEGDVNTAKQLFVDGRRAAGVASDKPTDIALAAITAAASAVRSGTTPARPVRVNAAVEAVYSAMLTVCVAAGDGSLARDVLRWMKMEGFKASEEAYMLAIKACCVAESNPESAFASGLPPALPGVEAGATGVFDVVGDAVGVVASGGSSGGSSGGGGGGGGGGGDERGRDDAAADALVAASAAPGGVATAPAGGAELDGNADEYLGQDNERAKPRRKEEQHEEEEEEEEEEKKEEFQWFVVPGGREHPPSFDEDGNEEGWTCGAGVSGVGGTSGANEAAAAAGPPQDGAGAAATAPATGAARLAGIIAARGNGVAEAGASRRPLAEAVNGDRSTGSDGGSDCSGDRAIPSGFASSISSGTGRENVWPSNGYANRSAADAVDSDGNTSADRSRGEGNNGPPKSLAGEGEDIGLGQGGLDWRRARALLDEMEAAEDLPTPPPAEAYETVLGACVAAGRVGDALEVAQAMAMAGHRPNPGLVSRLTSNHADVLAKEMREVEEAAAAPKEE